MIESLDVLKQSCRWHEQVVDRGILAFDRGSGTNLLLKSGATRRLCRRAPRVLQIALHTSCNLCCSFCYQKSDVPNRLDAGFLLDLLRRASDWGVLEVAFGGGEPLLFPGLTDLVQRLYEQTQLGINLTTNGTLLTRTIADQLFQSVGEIRISAHEDNHYRRTLRMLAGHNVGINWLVTPANVGLLEPYVRDFLELGARNVLLLGYKGNDTSMHLQPDHFDMLRRAVLKMQHLPLRLDGCWFPYLSELPHLFSRSDCGAGDEFLVITPDRAVQPCSFHSEKMPFEDFAELRAIYERFRVARLGSSVVGCTRDVFSDSTAEATPVVPALWVWHARASNNSGDWTIVGRFQSADRADKVARSLQELARAHEAFLASPEGQAWVEQQGYNGSISTPPLRVFGEKHGFDWSAEGSGLWWEEDGFGAPILTAGAVGNSVVVYHPYCMGLPEAPFRQFFSQTGASEFGYWQYGRPRVVVTANGRNQAAIGAVIEYLGLVKAAEYPSDVKLPPPWGEECTDARVCEDEDRRARLASGDMHVEQGENRLRLVLAFENTFAGTVALRDWLKKSGFTDIVISVDDELEAIGPETQAQTDPQTNLYGDVRPLGDRIKDSSAEKIAELVFTYYRQLPKRLSEALGQIAPEERLRLCRERWQLERGKGRDVNWQALLIIEGLGPIAGDWMRTLWTQLLEERCEFIGVAIGSLAASLPPDEAFGLAKEWFDAATEQVGKKKRLMAFWSLHHPNTLKLIENWWELASPGEAVTEDWGRLAAESQITWTGAQNWLDRGRPLSLIALDAMLFYAPRQGHGKQPTVPVNFGFPSFDTFRSVFEQYRERDNAYRVQKAVASLVENASILTQTR